MRGAATATRRSQPDEAHLAAMVSDLTQSSPEVFLRALLDSGNNYDGDSQALTECWALDTQDGDIQELLAASMAPGLYDFRVNRLPFVSNAPPQEAFGPIETADLVIGKVIDREGVYWIYRYDGDVEHWLIAGASGSAKTSFMLYIAIMALLSSEGGNPEADALVEELMKCWRDDA